MSLVRSAESVPRWVKGTLVLAGMYNLAWGLFAVLFPLTFFRWAAMPPPIYPEIWQCVGMLVGVYGIGYVVAARDPYRHWLIVLVGLLGKSLGPLGFIWYAQVGTLSWSWGLTIVANDLVWWIPFAVILYLAYRHNTNPRRRRETASLDEVMRTVQSHRGATLAELSDLHPVMVVFLRHAGCTFCREALSDLALRRGEIEAQGVQLALVHMSSPMQATRLMSDFGLDDIHRFSDPECELYEAFGMERGTIAQLVSPNVMWRGFVTAIVRGHGMGMIVGDGFQMPGVLVLDERRVLGSFRPKTAAERPNYVRLAKESAAQASQAMRT